MGLLRAGQLGQKYEEQGFVVGTFVEVPSPQIVEILGLAGFDFVVIDREHGAIDLETTENMIRAAEATGTVPLVRVPACDAVSIRQALDMGAAGVHIPQIQSAVMAATAARAARFFPHGERGLQPFVRAASYRAYPTAEFLQRSNEATVVVLQIEGAEGVAHLGEIAEVDGIDVLFVGPYDLSQSLGTPGLVDSPLVREKMRLVIERTQAKNVTIGTYCDDVRTALEWRNLGVTYLVVGMDAYFLLSAARRLVDQVKHAG